MKGMKVLAICLETALVACDAETPEGLPQSAAACLATAPHNPVKGQSR